MADQLQPGDVFLSITPELSGDNPHFHIVILKTINDDVLIVYTTKELVKARVRCQRAERIKFPHIDPETLVIVNAKHSSAFSIDSAIDCNKAILKPQDYFLNKQYFKKCTPIQSSKTIDIIKDGILKSDIVPDYIKKLL